MNAPHPHRIPRWLILIGASTGGTRVLTSLLAQVPPLPAAMVIVQHMPGFINASFVQSLARVSQAPVRLAVDEERLVEGEILLVPSDFHCSLVGNRSLAMTVGPKVNFVCPAVDVLMQSARPTPNQKIIGILLTGMGKDGAAGLRHLKGIGATTVVQNQATCAVYGMPGEAVKTGCVDHQLSPDGIGRLMQTLLGVSSAPALSNDSSLAPSLSR
jgi:two-component system chemotaxis response regulator CheB